MALALSVATASFALAANHLTEPSASAVTEAMAQTGDTGKAGSTGRTAEPAPAPVADTAARATPVVSQPEPAPTKPAPTEPAPKVTAGSDGVVRVALLGDSLAFESATHVRDAFSAADLSVETYTMGGTAICDFHQLMRRLATENAYDAVVIAFSGNALTPCMKDGAGNALSGHAHTAKYIADVIEAIDIFGAPTQVFVAMAPLSRTDSPEAAALRIAYDHQASRFDRVHSVDTGPALLRQGDWSETLPCLEFEGEANGCVDGEIVVRAPDGAHFCPGSGPALEGVTDTCQRWSSGAYRYAHALADPVITAVA